MPRLSDVRLTKRLVEAAGPGQCLSDSEVRGFRVSVSGSGSRRFLAVYRRTDANGGRKSTTLALGSYPTLTVEQAREKARLALAEVRGGGDPQKARKNALEALRSAPTVADLAEHYLGDYAASNRLQPSTVRNARDVLRPALSLIGALKVAAVKPGDARKVVAHLRDAGAEAAVADAVARKDALRTAQKALSAAEQALVGRMAGGKLSALWQRRRGLLRAVAEAERLAGKAKARAATGRAGIAQGNRLLAVLGAMFSLAVERGDRPDNPCAAVKKVAEEKRERWLSDDEVRRLLEACDTYEADPEAGAHAQWAANAVRLLLLTGARLREVLRAEWGQFDLERGLWVKPSSHTKQQRQHRLELGGPVLDLLSDMRERRPHARFLFPGDPSRAPVTGGEVKPRVDLARPWKAIAGLAGLEDVRLHDLRHTTASIMLSGGASLATVGRQLGHTQAATTQRYAHLMDTVQRDAGAAAGERMMALRGAGKRGEIVSIRAGGR